jgi:F-type H+-transporting ATPase subunit epsilon
MPPLMHLKILLPFKIFADKPDVTRVVAQTPHGSFGLLPHRLDCAMALAPGVLNYVTLAGENVYLAVDQGVLIKIGTEVLVSVRNAIGGTDLGGLHAAVKREFLTLDVQEMTMRAVMAKLESGLIRRLAAFPHAN